MSATPAQRERFYAPCPRGLEGVLADELRSLGVSEAAASRAGVAFEGPLDLCYRVNLESRIASRVLWLRAEHAYRNEDDVYQAVHALAWPDWFDVGRSLRVEVNAHRSPLKSLDFITLRIKDAICDRFRTACSARPDVDTRAPDVRVFAFFDHSKMSIYLDTSGDALFKRGYRDVATEAPLKENLAAGIIALTGWQPEETLFDPMCGSATLLIEAALKGLAIAPGHAREFGFAKLGFYSARAWQAVREAALAREQRARKLAIFGGDSLAAALRVAHRNIESAGLARHVQVKQQDVLQSTPPAAAGVLVANPPYGVRVGSEQGLAAFYPKLGDVLKQRYAGWRAYILSADPRFDSLLRLKASKRTPLFNGPLECRLYEYVLRAGSMRKIKPAGSSREA